MTIGAAIAAATIAIGMVMNQAKTWRCPIVDLSRATSFPVRCAVC